MTGLEWSIFLSGIAVGVVSARAVVTLFWRLTTHHRYTRRH